MNPMAWAEALRTVRVTAVELENEGITLDAINIGGGFPYGQVGDSTAPRLEDIANATTDEIRLLPYEMELIIEPGRALVADAAVLVASVIGRITRNGTKWLYLDAGVYNALFETLSCQCSIRYPVTSLDPTSNVTRSMFTLAGPTGDGLDVISRNVMLPENTDVGDRIIFHDVGAYSLSLANAFNGFPKPAVYFV
jgi:ornithine decarboxylase